MISTRSAILRLDGRMRAWRRSPLAASRRRRVSRKHDRASIPADGHGFSPAGGRCSRARRGMAAHRG